MTPAERSKNILLAAKLGPLTPFFGIVNGRCECGKPKSQKHKPGKHPHGGGWQRQNATSDHATIAVWIGQYPNANFAVITGVDTVVLDLDVRPGKDGVDQRRVWFYKVLYCTEFWYDLSIESALCAGEGIEPSPGTTRTLQWLLCAFQGHRRRRNDRADPCRKHRQQRRNNFVGTVHGLMPVASARAVQEKAEGGGVQPPGAQ